MELLKKLQTYFLRFGNLIYDYLLKPLINRLAALFKFVRGNKSLSFGVFLLVIYLILAYLLIIKYKYFGYDKLAYISNIIFIFLAVGFAYTLLYKYYDRGDKINSRFSIIFKRITLTLFCIGLIFGLLYLISYASFFSDLFSVMFIVTGSLFTLYVINKQLNKLEFIQNLKNNNLFNIIYHVLFLIPCIVFDGGLQVFNEFRDTPKVIYQLLILEAVIIILYFLIPYLIEKFYTRNSKLLLNKPVYLHKPNIVATYKDLNPDKDNDKKDDSNKDKKKSTVDYNYGLSCWIYVDNYGSNYNNNTDSFVDLLSYGDKPSIQYNNKINTLRVISKQGIDDIEVIYETNKIPLQRWNHFVINYDNGNVDIFINNKLVGTKQGVLPYMKYDNIVTGQPKGIPGGICNVQYYYNPMSKISINLEYSTLKDKTPPII